jgi:ribonuclease HII
MAEALEQVKEKLSAGEPFEIIIDGSFNFLPDEPAATVLVGADGIIPSVSAASIIAKVARDTYMATEAHTAYPAYGFDLHVGYGTALHRSSLKEFGVTPIHRKSYKPVAALSGMLESFS